MLLYGIWTKVVSLLLFVQVVSILVQEPTDVFAVRGSTVSLPCYTNLSVPVSWEIEKTGGGINWEHFYKGYGDIPDIYQYKYNVSTDSTLGQYNLTIINVQPEDSGTYRCGDNLGLGLRKYKEGVPGNGATAELVVIVDDEIKCRHESCIITPEGIIGCLIKINCNVTYRGNISPNLHWTLRNSMIGGSGISLQSLSKSSRTTEGADSKLESEISVDASTVPVQFYIGCEAMGRNETLLTWISEKIHTFIHNPVTVRKNRIILIQILVITFGLLIPIVILFACFYWTIIFYDGRMCCATIRRRLVPESVTDERTALGSTPNPEQIEEVARLEVPPHEDSAEC